MQRKRIRSHQGCDSLSGADIYVTYSSPTRCDTTDLPDLAFVGTSYGPWPRSNGIYDSVWTDIQPVEQDGYYSLDYRSPYS